MTIKIRPATAADAQKIRSLISQVRINPMNLDWERFLIADDEGEFVGCIQVKPHKEPGVRELASVAVAPGRQGQGIGTLLMRAMLEREPGLLYLTCLRHNVSYYQQFGFRELELKEAPRSFHLQMRASRLFLKMGIFEGGAVMKREGDSTAPVGNQAASTSND
jgi:N-acetylglutamate synthase-like GNAT family acetyltransferase